MLRLRVLVKQNILVMAMLLFLQSCTTSVVVKGTVPTPLVSVIPAQVGVYYSDEFRNFMHEEVIRDSGSWRIDLGKQNLSFFQNLTKSLFAGVQDVHQSTLTTEESLNLDEVSVASEEMKNLDGVFIPTIKEYGFLTPSISGLKFYSASIEYSVAMFNKVGAKIGDWNIVGYGKSEGGIFSSDDAINEATVLAIRDGGARIAIELIDQPAVRAWLQSIDESIESSARPPGLANSPESVDGAPDE